MTYRDDLAALSARHAALQDEVARKTRELDAASQLLSDATARAKLPVLDNIRVAAPCSAEWSAMTGDERVRHCGACKKDVYNLSGMTRDEAQALIVEKNGRLCVRYFQRADGTILTKDCSVGVSRRRKRRVIAAGAAAMLAAAVAFVARPLGDALDARSPLVQPPTGPDIEVLGGAVAADDDSAGAMEEFLGEVAAPDEPVREFKGEMVAPSAR